MILILIFVNNFSGVCKGIFKILKILISNKPDIVPKLNKSKKYDYGNAFYNFSDADKFGKFDEAIKQLASNNIINGYEDKTFRADKNITRAEVAKIIFYASDRESNLGQKIYSDLNKNYWAYKFLMDASA